MQKLEPETEANPIDNEALVSNINELSINNENESADDGFDEIEDRDPEIEEYAKNFRNIYSNELVEYLKTLVRNDSLSVTSIPTKKYCKETFDEDLMNSTTLNFNFEGLECDPDGKIKSVIATSFDRSTKYDFSPFLCSDYGPYFRTTLYACYYNVGRKSSKEEMFFIDLPLHLYNLLEAAE
jgi:hypothetical protein